jgi:hypothetical protein
MATEAAWLKRKNLQQGRKKKNRLDTNRPSHGRGLGALAVLSVSWEFILTRLPKGLKLFASANFHVFGN